jgi:GT2 family glycosyltransferase
MERPPAEPAQPLKVTALVVSCNRLDRLHRCLECLEKSSIRESMEVLVVDNGTDGIAAVEADFPKARFVRLPKNFGLTKALNIGVRASEGESILLLHEDTEVFPDTVAGLLAVLDSQPEIGAVCPLLVTAEGTPAPQLGELPPEDSYTAAEIREEPYTVQYPRGAAVLLRSFFLKALGGIDERYGQFGSDAELAFQVRRSGKKILLLPAVQAVHHGHGEEPALRMADRKIGTAVFISKHLGLMAGLQARIGGVFGALSRFQFGQLSYLLSGQKIDGTQS